ncbi:MAG: hypothetical protein ACLSBF_01410 [Alphaproteobacteria bacterium]
MKKKNYKKDMDKYLEIDNETDEMLANIAEVAANIGNFLKSPIIAQKKRNFEIDIIGLQNRRKKYSVFNN